MDNSTMLVISYENLKEMLEVMQEDGLSADGCRYDLHEDAAKYIADEAASGSIATIPAERHGAWTKGYCKDEEMNCVFCSACGKSAYWDTDYGQQLFPYCPYCGSKMEGS